MTKRIKLIALIVVVLAAGAGIFLIQPPIKYMPKQPTKTEKKRILTDACDLFTATDAARVLGQPMHQDEHSSNTGKPGVIIPATYCAYRSDDTNARLSLVTITVSHADTADKVAANKQNFIASRIESDIAIPNLGDNAYFVPTPGLYKLHVIKGAYHIVIDVGNDRQALPDQATDAAVARAILVKI